MKNTLIIRHVATVATAVGLLTVSHAQALQGLGAARAGAVIPPPPAASASAAAQMATAAAVRPPVSAATTHAASQSAINGNPAHGLNVQATTHASAEGKAHGLSVAADASRSDSVNLDSAHTVAEIKQTGFAQREKVMADVQARLDASAKTVSALEMKADRMADKSRATFAKMLVEIRAREKALRTSLREANKETREKAWGEIQSELAKNYGAYAEIVAQAEATADADANVGK